MPSVRQQLNIAAPTRAVWDMITTAEGLTSWWVDEARVDARKGGRIVLTSEGDDGEPVEEVGLVHACRPTAKFEIAWDSNSPAPTKGTRIAFQVARDGDETRISVIHSGGGILDDEEEWEQLDKSWKSALKALRGALES